MCCDTGYGVKLPNSWCLGILPFFSQQLPHNCIALPLIIDSKDNGEIFYPPGITRKKSAPWSCSRFGFECTQFNNGGYQVLVISRVVRLPSESAKSVRLVVHLKKHCDIAISQLNASKRSMAPRSFGV